MADFYSTLILADAYHLARGNTTWTGADALKNEALLRGSEYIDQAYRSSFPGYKVGERAQLREWPRNDAYDTEGNYLDPAEVPSEVFNATYEAALRELVSPGALLPDFTPTGQQKSVKVDVIAIEYVIPTSAQGTLPVIPIINRILAPILTGSDLSSIAGRAVRT